MTAKSGRGSRVKGYLANKAVIDMLHAHGFPWVEKREAGASGDDVIGLRHFSIEVKDQSTMTLSAWLHQATSQARPSTIGVVWHKKKGKTDPLDWYVTLQGRDMLRLIGLIEGVDTKLNKETTS